MGKKAVTLRAIIWLVVGGALLCLFGSKSVQSAETGDTGHINEDTRICQFDRITPDTVETYKKYNAIIDRLEEVGFAGLTPVQKQLGAFLTYQVGCGTVAQDYRIILTSVLGDYILFMFDEGYGYEPLRYLTTLESFHADELL